MPEIAIQSSMAKPQVSCKTSGSTAHATDLPHEQSKDGRLQRAAGVGIHLRACTHCIVHAAIQEVRLAHHINAARSYAHYSTDYYVKF